MCVFAFIQVCAAVMASQGESKTSFSKWKYAHYFPLVEHKDKNILVKCKLCLSGSKVLSTAINSNSVEKSVETPPETTCLDEARSKPGVGRLEVSQAPPAKQQRLDFNRTVSQGHINKAIARYVVENMQSVSTVESPAFWQLVSMITCLGGTRQMGQKTFSNNLDKEYSKMESELKKTFEGLDYIAATADIWSVHDRSFLGMTAHWIKQLLCFFMFFLMHIIYGCP